MKIEPPFKYFDLILKEMQIIQICNINTKSNNHSANKKYMYIQSQKVNKIIYIFIFVFVFVMHKNVNENMMNIEFNHYNLCKGQSQGKLIIYILRFYCWEFSTRNKNSGGRG